ncbi:FUSC family protein [Pseudomonas sp. 3JA]
MSVAINMFKKNGTQASIDVFRRAFFEWARTDGVVWVYIAKLLIAAFLTLWLSYVFELAQPSIAVITVFIVMQPQSGQVFAKSFYRMLGSVIGLAVMLVLIALFSQERVLFLMVVALWVGLCTAGAARYRDFRSYACVLAGYSATQIGLPAVLQPQDAFMLAVWRLLEIFLAIVCSGVVSAVILPQTSAAAMRNALYLRFGEFTQFVLDNLGGGVEKHFEAANINFVSQAIGLEALRSATWFEDPHMRLRAGRLARANSEFMGVTTRYHALHQVLVRFGRKGEYAALDALTPCLELLKELLMPWAGKPLTDIDAEVLARELIAHQDALREIIRSARVGLQMNGSSRTIQMDFETAGELLYRLVTDLHNYLLTHASLADHHHERENWRFGFSSKANMVGALVAGARTAIMILVLGTVWIETAWPSGSTFVLVATAIAAMLSATPNPAKQARQMAVGTFCGAILGCIEMFFVFPHLDGFPLLCLALAPVYIAGGYLTVKPPYAGYGMGLLIFFSFGAVPANLTVYDPSNLINQYIALVLSQTAAALFAAILLPPTSAWLWRRLEQDLRMRVTRAMTSKLVGLSERFESSTRDLMNQAYGVSATHPKVQRSLLRWMFLVLEVGHGIIELREEQSRLPDLACYAPTAPWRQAVRGMGMALAELFRHPSVALRENTLEAVEYAIATTVEAMGAFEHHFEYSPLRRITSYLHFIRSSLLDPESPLADETFATVGN